MSPTPADLNNVDPPPWQTPFTDISFKLPDGTPVKAQGTISEAWLWFFLQLRAMTQQSGGTTVLPLVLQGLPNRTARTDSQLGAVTGLLQSLVSANSKIARLESELGTMQALVRDLAARMGRAALPAAAVNGLAALAFATAARRQPALTDFQFLQGTLAARPAASGYSDGTVLYYATDEELFYVIAGGAWAQAMAFISYNPAGTVITFTGNLSGAHAQNVGTGDTPTFVDIVLTGYASLDAELASLQSQITTLQTDYDAHAHGAGSLTAPSGGGAVTGTTGGTDHPD